MGIVFVIFFFMDIVLVRLFFLVLVSSYGNLFWFYKNGIKNF